MTYFLIKRDLKDYVHDHLILASMFISVLIGVLIGFILLLTAYKQNEGIDELFLLFFFGLFIGCFLVFPIVLTFVEVCQLFKCLGNIPYKLNLGFDLFVIALGTIYSLLYLQILKEVKFLEDWNIALYNFEIHTPIFTQSLPTILIIVIISMCGYLLVSCIPLKNTPPLILVLGISSMYLGNLIGIIWGIQVFNTKELFDLFLLLLPINSIIITVKTTKYKIDEWYTTPYESHKIDQIHILRWCNQHLQKSERWPIAAFLFMWPLLGIIVTVLILFGQSPNSIITAWTETSDWNLSQRTAPQNLFYDEHYLCTVAAGGHKKIVKPIRLGVRRGHEVIVNRQLCIANAFEQILEEKTPKFHKMVRYIYDTYGFPIAKLIHSKYTADFIYFLMKPLEWIFLIVLYLTDAHPEDRIAIQYTGKNLKDFK